MEAQEIFSLIGFTKTETSVYLALLNLGSSTTGPIIKEADIPQGKVYVILNKLINKGIVTYTIKSGIKHFQAKDPKTIVSWFEKEEAKFMEKKKQLLALMPNLAEKYAESSYEKQVEIYEGFNAMKTVHNLLLDKGKEMFIIGTTASIPEQVETFFAHWHKERIKRKINIHFIYSEERKKFAQNREKMKYTQVKYLKLPVSPSWTTIVEDYVVTVTMIDEQNISCFLIKDKNVAKAQKDYFEVLWKGAK
jgi:sugar-specific transcriptional regulator TrmB